MRHANGALGVAHVKLLVSPENLDALARQLTSVVGAAPRVSTSSEVSWDLEGQPSSSGVTGGEPALILQAARTGEEREYVRARGAGIFELGIRVGSARGGGEAKTPYGRIVWID